MGLVMQPLADKMRPTNLDMVFGQKHLIGKDKPLRKMYDNKQIASMIFYGAPGCGKTTVAMLMAQNCGLPFYKINATNAGTKDIQEIVQISGGESIVLYVDEIQYFNKKQQQSLLEYIENGIVTLIASTTENPSFYIFSALLSRVHTFEFNPLTREDMKDAIVASIENVDDKDFKKYHFEDGAIDFIIDYSDGDVRKAINVIDLMALIGFNEINVDAQMVADISSRKVFKHDMDGNNHYDVLSAFQKSVRGSDVDASLHYLARLIYGGDVKSACRRLQVIAAEDIGLADPNAVSVVYACTHSAMELGMPEARLPLAEATIYLAKAPKSNSAYLAIDAALADIEKGVGDIPEYLKDSHYSKVKKGPEYKYPHIYPHHYVGQQYLPSMYDGHKYYEPQENEEENKSKEYWDKIKEEP